MFPRDGNDHIAALVKRWGDLRCRSPVVERGPRTENRNNQGGTSAGVAKGKHPNQNEAPARGCATDAEAGWRPVGNQEEPTWHQ